MEYQPIEPSKFVWQLHIDGDGHHNEVPQTRGDCLVRITYNDSTTQHAVLHFAPGRGCFLDCFDDAYEFDIEPGNVVEFIQLEKPVSSDS